MRFVRGYALVHLLSPVDMSSGGLHISPTVFSVALFGVGWQGSFSPHKVYAPSGAAGVCPLVVFLFYKVRRPTSWPFGKICRATIYSWGSPFDCLCPALWRRLWSCHRTWWPFMCKIACMYHPTFLEVSYFVARFLYSPAIVWWQYFGILVPWLSVKKGIQNYQGGSPRLWAISWEVISLPSGFVILWWRRSR